MSETAASQDGPPYSLPSLSYTSPRSSLLSATPPTRVAAAGSAEEDFTDSISHGSLPIRPSAFTPADQQSSVSTQRDRLLTSLKPALDANAAITGFCNDPAAVVHLSVKDINHSKIVRKQYNVAAAMHVHVAEILARWLASGRIRRASSHMFNSPLLPVPKKDETGRMTGVRLCIDIIFLLLLIK